MRVGRFPRVNEAARRELVPAGWMRLAPMILIGTAQELVWLGCISLGPLREHTTPFIVWMLVAFALCLWAVARITIQGRQAVLVMMGFALLFRLTVLPQPPYQSEDVYRYIWDARTASLGIDPFRYPPDAPELEHLRDAKIYPMINSKPYVTAYPPVSQMLFRLSYLLFGDRVVPMKAVFSLLEVCSLLLAWRLLVTLGFRLESLFLLARNPFFIFEFSYSGHSDSSMIFLALLVLYLLERNRQSLAMAGYAGAALAKLHPALWFPLFVRRTGWKASLVGIIAGTAIVLAYFTPESLLRYLNSLRLYYKLFEFNAGIHYFLRFIGRSLYHESWDQATGPYLAACLAVIAVIIWWKFPIEDTRSLLHAIFWIMTADLCLCTTVHPWYISWAAFALPFFPYAFMAYWTGASFLSYIAYQYRPVYEPSWALMVEYLPVFALMAWEAYTGRPLLELVLGRRRQ